MRPISGDVERQLTKDTKDDLFNGDIDWVYAEELAVRSNYFWSPDSKQIVFLHMDETKVADVSHRQLDSHSSDGGQRKVSRRSEIQILP